jgi:general secretion pathway protein D
VTPHINEGRYVTLDIRQEVSQAQSNTLGGINSPVFRNRTAETTMVVKDNQTLVIGGIIDEQRDTTDEGIPWFHRIPIIGRLFGVSGQRTFKRELVLLITPRVIADLEEGERITDMVRRKVLTLKEGIDEYTKVPGEKERSQ